MKLTEFTGNEARKKALQQDSQPEKKPKPCDCPRCQLERLLGEVRGLKDDIRRLERKLGEKGGFNE